jgi:peptidoglycan/LPS O-acetylase OafA/YrhL
MIITHAPRRDLQGSIFAPQKTKLPVIQGLRGIAALAVCWCHLTYGLPEYRNTLLGHSGHYGFLGVDVFFVISGFIVPYAMFVAGYRLKNMKTFLMKRMIRVEPPYLVSILLSVMMWYLALISPMYAGGEPKIGATQLALHLGYLIPFFPKYEWISGVYWSLAVEFQYYLSISLLLPLLVSRRPAVRIASCLLFAASSLVLPQRSFLPELAPLFVLGFVGMLRLIGRASWKELLLVAPICAALAFRSEGMLVTVTGVITLAVILFLRRMPIALLWLGDISYSLYLIHDMVGRRVVHLAARFVPGSMTMMLPFIAVLFSVLFALVMFRLVELPAKRMAAKWKYTEG